MKRILFTLSAFFFALFFFVSCEKVPEITLSSPTSIDVSAQGGSSTITFTTNADWAVRSSESWVSVSPSSGTVTEEGKVTVNVNCAANTTYEDRSATITISVGDALQTVKVNQPANLGLIVPNKLYELTGKATITVEVQSNVQYDVSISDNWITQSGTKGLSTDKLLFDVKDNDTYNARSANIIIKPLEGNIPEQVIAVKQTQKDAILIDDASYDMPYGGGEIQVNVKANVEFDVKPDVEWIHFVETKALSNSTIRLVIDENKTFSSREGRILVSQQNGSLSYEITVKQAGRIAVLSLSLNKTEMTLEVGAAETLVATVKPDDATDKTVFWSSSNSAVATISSSGLVTAKAEGTATITASAGGKTASCKVTVSGGTAQLNGHEYIDLGLPSGLKWASCNVGATKPEEYGDYFAWGETEPKTKYTWETCKFRVSGDSWDNVQFNKYCSKSNYWGGTGPMDNKTVLDLEDDAAHVNWGGTWRMPTYSDWDELKTKCTWTWTTQNGVKGYKVSSKTNGKSIFLPAAGYRRNADLNVLGSYGFYWSSSLDTVGPCSACGVIIGSDNYRWGNLDRYYGFSVRSVSE